LSKPDLIQLAQTTLEDSKALNLVLIDLQGKSSLADCMLIASGTSQRHVAALAQHLSEKLKQEAGLDVKVEGAEGGDWVLVDAGDIIVHLFRPEVREFYNLEKMWATDFPAMQPTRAGV
jgi:ribosome-associated protein